MKKINNEDISLNQIRGPFPRGWYRFSFSKDIKPGSIITRRFFSRELVAFRTLDGRVAVVDAHCPHLGAHLGKGGRIINNDLHCPFHGWKFSIDGQCTGTPQGTTPKTKLNVYATDERGGCIFFFFSLDNRSPDISLDQGDTIDPNLWCLSGNWSCQFRGNIQDIHENNCDIGHLLTLHKKNVCKGNEFPKITSFEKFDGGHAKIVLDLTQSLSGFKMNTVLSTIYKGPGYCLAHAQSKLPFLFVNFITPIDENMVDYVHQVYLPQSLNSSVRWIIGAFLKWQIKISIQEDIMVWTSMRHVPRPMLQDFERPILEFRRWMTQFYNP